MFFFLCRLPRGGETGADGRGKTGEKLAVKIIVVNGELGFMFNTPAKIIPILIHCERTNSYRIDDLKGKYK